MADFVVATEQSPKNWLHSADVIVADVETADAAMRLAEELLRRYPGCVAACVLVRGRSS